MFSLFKVHSFSTENRYSVFNLLNFYPRTSFDFCSKALGELKYLPDINARYDLSPVLSQKWKQPKNLNIYTNEDEPKNGYDPKNVNWLYII